jgi:dolichyl-phosphate-mannose-protein mannosyltransferase
MRPPAITVDFTESDTQTRSSSEFEEISYPSNHHHWSAPQYEEELPLHYMSEEKARRRVVRGPESAGVHDSPANDGPGYGGYDDDEGKDVYNKPRPIQNRIGSGRLPQPLPPPPTTLVRQLYVCTTYN